MRRLGCAEKSGEEKTRGECVCDCIKDVDLNKHGENFQNSFRMLFKMYSINFFSLMFSYICCVNVCI